MNKFVDAMIPYLDFNKDGKITAEDVRQAAAKAEADLKARATNMLQTVIVAGACLVAGGVIGYVAHSCK